MQTPLSGIKERTQMEQVVLAQRRLQVLLLLKHPQLVRQVQLELPQ